MRGLWLAVGGRGEGDVEGGGRGGEGAGRRWEEDSEVEEGWACCDGGGESRMIVDAVDTPRGSVCVCT